MAWCRRHHRPSEKSECAFFKEKIFPFNISGGCLLFWGMEFFTEPLFIQNSINHTRFLLSSIYSYLAGFCIKQLWKVSSTCWTIARIYSLTPPPPTGRDYKVTLTTRPWQRISPSLLKEHWISLQFNKWGFLHLCPTFEIMLQIIKKRLTTVLCAILQSFLANLKL